MSTLTQHAASDLFRAEPHHYLDMGPGRGEVAIRTVGSGPDVLFVHGWPVHGATFRKLLPHLVEHVSCHVLDLPGAGSSRFDDATDVSFENHIHSVRRSVELLGLDDVAVVGHDSGGMIIRHALAGHDSLRSMVLINTEPSGGLGWRFKMFLIGRHIPGFGAGLGWVAGKRRLRRNGFILGDAFADRSHLDGEFDEFFLQPLHTDAAYRSTTMKIFTTFDTRFIDELREVQRRIEVPVGLVWGAEDKFFPLVDARKMVADFPDATITEIADAGLFSHEEKPAEVAAAMLPTLLTSAN